jgi:murein DD-endopeptidase MepM/ murein hydrolase activator NlpD
MAEIRLNGMRALAIGASLLALSACGGGFDLDLRDMAGGFDTSDAARQPTERRPSANEQGVITYPNFQVAIARRGDTVADVATRVGMDANTLARHNGLELTTRLRPGEVVALPGRPGTGAGTAGGEVDITALAGSALDRADAENRVTTTPLAPVQTGPEPIQHKVTRGETAYSISRLYGVSVRALGDWNGLGSDLTVREGQYLLIPVASGSAVSNTVPVITTEPGEGSPTPQPPSASAPLPEETIETTPTTAPPAQNLAEDRSTGGGRLMMPVNGSIIRGYEKGKTDGIDISAAKGTPVRAADAGTVAAITRDTDGVPILVLRHSGNLLTVYANIDKVKFEKGDTVARGQTVAEVRDSSPAFLHFEVRQGFDSVDPVDFLN